MSLLSSWPMRAKDWRASLSAWANELKTRFLGESVVKIGLCALAFFLPLTIDLRLEDMFDLPKATLLHVGTAVLLWAWVRRIQKEQVCRVGWMPLDGVVMAKWAVAVIATIHSIHRYTSIMGNYRFYQDGLWSLSCYVAIYFLVSRELTARDAQAVLTAGLAACFPVSIYALIQGASKDPMAPWMAGSGWVASTMGNPNFLGALLAMMIPLACARLFKAKNLLTRIAWVVWLACALPALMLTKTRSSWLGLLMAGVVFVIFSRGAFKLAWRRMVVLLLLACALVSVWFLAFPSWRIGFADRASVFLDRDEGSARARLAHWRTALEAATDHPWLGSGLDTFAFVFLPHEDIDSVRLGGRLQVASNAHNEVLQTFATLGLLGLFVYIWFLVRWGWVAWRTAEAAQSEEKFWWAALAASGVALWVHSEFNFSVLTTWFFFWVISGALSRQAYAGEAGHEEVPAALVAPQFGRIFSAAVVMTSLAAFWVSARFYQASRVYVSGIKLENSGDLPMAMKMYESAVELDPGMFPAYFHLGSSAGRLAGMQQADPAALRQGLDEAMHAFKREAEFFPLAAMAHNNLAMAYMWRVVFLKEKYLPQAFQEINLASRLGPAIPDVWDHFAQMHDYLGNRQAAILAWGRALDALPSYYPAWAWLHSRLPAPPFSFYEQNLEIDDVPLGRPFDVKKEAGIALKILNDQDKDLTLFVRVLESKDTPLPLPPGYVPLVRPERFITINKTVFIKTLSVGTIDPIIQFPSQWHYMNRHFYCCLYIGVKGESVPSGRYIDLFIKTYK